MIKKDQKGATILFFVLILTFISVLISSSMLFIASKNIERVKDETKAIKSYYAAESGLEDTIYRIKSGKNYSSSSNFSLDGAEVNIVVSEGNGSTTVSASSDYQNAVKNLSSKIKTLSTKVNFSYGALIGEGGIEMGENAKIKGDVYSNGNIKGSNGATIEGDVFISGSPNSNITAQSVVCNTDNKFGRDYPFLDYAQSFKVDSNSVLSKVSIYIKKIDNPKDLRIRIVKDDNGRPGYDQLTYKDINVNFIDYNYKWLDVVFPQKVELMRDNVYWIVFDALEVDKNNGYWVVCSDSNGGYTDGVSMYGLTWYWIDGWYSSIGDVNFKVYTQSEGSELSNTIVLSDARANTILNSKICGDAYYQNIDQSSYDFLNSPTSPPCDQPLTNGSTYPNAPNPMPIAMPISEDTFLQWKTDAQNIQVINGDYAIDSDQFLGPVFINGNLLLNSNNKTLTVTGTIYVNGNIEVDNGSAIKCASSYGSNSCIVVANGWIHIQNNASFFGSGTQGSYLFLASRSACNGSLSQVVCTHHGSAIDLHNNVQGVIFYADRGIVNLHNGVVANQVSAYKLNMGNDAVIIYDHSLKNIQLSFSSSTDLDIINWKEVK